MDDPTSVSVGFKKDTRKHKKQKVVQEKKEEPIKERKTLRKEFDTPGIKILQLEEDGTLKIELDDKLHDTISTICKWKGLSINQYMAQLITEYVESKR